MFVWYVEINKQLKSLKISKEFECSKEIFPFCWYWFSEWLECSFRTWKKLTKQRFIILISVFNFGSNIFQFGKNFCEEFWLSINPKHWLTQSIDNFNAAFPESVLVRRNQEWLQGVTDFIAHVTEKF